MCIGSETKAEMEEILGLDAERVFYVEDGQMHAAFRWIQARMPLSMGSNPLYYLQVLTTQLRQRKVVRRLVKKLRIDVLHQPTPISPRVPSLLPHSAPLVIGPMNGGMEYPPGFRFLQPHTGMRNLLRRLSNRLPRAFDAKRQAECLIVANQRTEDGLPSGVRGKIFRMVENAVFPEVWAREQVGEGAESASAPRPFELIFIGRLERWKGPEWAIEAIARAATKVDCRLKIIGELRDERQRLTERASELGIASRVTFLGWLPQERCAELLGTADVLILPSVLDAGATVVLEAMASGKPVIAADWGAPADILDTDCGILVDVRDPDSLVGGLEEAILKLATDRKRCSSMGRAARAKVLAEYTWPAKIERLVAIYRAALQSREGSKRRASVLSQG
jgi:glycosyltransferase involved in cell wall biosynthesis